MARIHRSGVDTLVTQPMVVQPISLYGRRLGDELQLRVEFTGPRPALIHPCNCPRPRNSYRREVGGGGEGGEFRGRRHPPTSPVFAQTETMREGCFSPGWDGAREGEQPRFRHLVVEPRNFP